MDAAVASLQPANRAPVDARPLRLRIFHTAPAQRTSIPRRLQYVPDACRALRTRLTADARHDGIHGAGTQSCMPPLGSAAEICHTCSSFPSTYTDCSSSACLHRVWRSGGLSAPYLAHIPFLPRCAPFPRLPVSDPLVFLETRHGPHAGKIEVISHPHGWSQGGRPTRNGPGDATAHSFSG